MVEIVFKSSISSGPREKRLVPHYCERRATSFRLFEIFSRLEFVFEVGSHLSQRIGEIGCDLEGAMVVKLIGDDLHAKGNVVGSLSNRHIDDGVVVEQIPLPSEEEPPISQLGADILLLSVDGN